MWGGVSRLFRCSVSTQDLGFLNTFVLEIMIRMYTNDVSKLLNKTSLASIRLIRKITQYREIFNTESPRFFFSEVYYLEIISIQKTFLKERFILYTHG